MPRVITVVSLSFMLVAGAASAKVCKVVGPDGSVTFTDRPSAECPTGKPASSSPARTGSTAPANPAATTPPATTPAANPQDSDPRSTGAKRASVAPRGSAREDESPEPAASPATDAAARLDPAVEKSVIGILGLEDLVKRAHELCVGVLPTSAGRYDAFASQWRDRNGGAVTLARRALTKAFEPRQQQPIVDLLGQRNRLALASVQSAPQASRIKWCDQTAGEVVAGKLDAKDNLTKPLAAY